jgi:hypothetical protein
MSSYTNVPATNTERMTNAVRGTAANLANKAAYTTENVATNLASGTSLTKE